MKPTQETGKYLPRRERAEFKVHIGGGAYYTTPPPKKIRRHTNTSFLTKGTIITLLCLYHNIKLVSHTVEKKKKKFKAA